MNKLNIVTLQSTKTLLTWCIISDFQIKDKSGMLGPLYGDFEKSKVASMCKELGQGAVLFIPKLTLPYTCICFSFDTKALKNTNVPYIKDLLSIPIITKKSFLTF